MHCLPLDRASPPANSNPEASNFPTTTYDMSSETTLFQPPASYPEAPKDMWYQVPLSRHEYSQNHGSPARHQSSPFQQLQRALQKSPHHQHYPKPSKRHKCHLQNHRLSPSISGTRSRRGRMHGMTSQKLNATCRPSAYPEEESYRFYITRSANALLAARVASQLQLIKAEEGRA